ncbi:MAG: hypothetical protein SVU32_04115 [Candidatus Nanohaloarchaea archaeon]|nr:hypothetical protein [Candidatus Nanohaloarchaea archaeon]
MAAQSDPEITVEAEGEQDIIAVSDIDTGSLKEQRALEQFLDNNDLIQEIEQPEEDDYHIDQVTDEIGTLLPEITALVLAYRGDHQDELQDQLRELGETVVAPSTLERYPDENQIGFYNKSNAHDEHVERIKSEYEGENLYSRVEELDATMSFLKGENIASRVDTADILGSRIEGQNVLENVEDLTIQESYVTGRNAAKRADEIDIQDTILRGTNTLSYVEEAGIYDSLIAGESPLQRHSEEQDIDIHNSIIIGSQPCNGTGNLDVYDSIIAGEDPLNNADARLHNTYVINDETVEYYSTSSHTHSEPDSTWQLNELLGGEDL